MLYVLPQVVSSSFTKSVIRSRAAMTYAEAQSRIDDQRLTDELSVSEHTTWGVNAGACSASRCCHRPRRAVLAQTPLPCPPLPGWLLPPTPASLPQVNLRTLNSLAKLLRRKRADRGALSLASPEVKFEIDTETHDPLDVGMYQVGACLCVCWVLGCCAGGQPQGHTVRCMWACTYQVGGRGFCMYCCVSLLYCVAALRVSRSSAGPCAAFPNPHLTLAPALLANTLDCRCGRPTRWWRR